VQTIGITVGGSSGSFGLIAPVHPSAPVPSHALTLPNRIPPPAVAVFPVTVEVFLKVTIPSSLYTPPPSSAVFYRIDAEPFILMARPSSLQMPPPRWTCRR